MNFIFTPWLHPTTKVPAPSEEVEFEALVLPPEVVRYWMHRDDGRNRARGHGAGAFGGTMLNAPFSERPEYAASSRDKERRRLDSFG